MSLRISHMSFANHESYPALEKTDITTQTCSSSLLEKSSPRMTASQCRCMKVRRVVFLIMLSAKHTALF